MTGRLEGNLLEVKSQPSLHRKEKLALYNKRYKEKHKEVISLQRKGYRKENQDKIKESVNKWRENNKDNVACWGHKRRTAKKGNGGFFTVDEIHDMFMRQNGECVYCRVYLDSYHRDHILPIHLGGSSYIHNIQLLCSRCNLSKGAKHPDVYEKKIGYVRVS